MIYFFMPYHDIIGHNVKDEYICDKIDIIINQKEFFSYPDPESNYFLPKWMDVTEKKKEEAIILANKLSLINTPSPVELLLKYQWYVKQATKHHAKAYKNKKGITKIK